MRSGSSNIYKVMDWYYVDRRAYGITVNSQSSPGLKDLLKELCDILAYDSEMSLSGKGTSFIYVKSTYNVISYDSSLNTNYVSLSYPKRHEKEPNREAPKLSDEEKDALDQVRQLCNCQDSGEWIREAVMES